MVLVPYVRADRLIVKFFSYEETHQSVKLTNTSIFSSVLSKNKVAFSGKFTLQTTTTVSLQPMCVLSFFTHNEERLVTIEAFLYRSVHSDSLGNLVERRQ